MSNIAFHITGNKDPEERIEEDMLWEAMREEYGDDIVAIKSDIDVIEDEEIPTFGRMLRYKSCAPNPVGFRLDYWADQAFLKHANREFHVYDFERAKAVVQDMHSRNMGAFLKSTLQKQAIFRIPVGTSFDEEIGEMAYSFIDGGPDLMVQELCTFDYEHRFFCIDREIVCHSPVQWALTPKDFPLLHGTVYKKPNARVAELNVAVVDQLVALAKGVAGEMDYPHAVIDCSLINGAPGLVEFNPMQLGQTGLYAADVKSLASASRKLVSEFMLGKTPVLVQ